MKLPVNNVDPAVADKFGFIHTFSRKEAIADGEQILVDRKITNEAGFKIPMYITQSVWEKYVKVPEGMEGIQDLEGRLWDILTMTLYYIRKCDGSRCEFKVSVTLPDNGDWTPNEKKDQSRTQRLVTLVAEIGATDFDNPAPCLCICLPTEV